MDLWETNFFSGTVAAFDPDFLSQMPSRQLVATFTTLRTFNYILIGYSSLRLFQHTELEHTPFATFTNRLYRESFHSWVGELPGVCSRGVL